MDLSEILNLVLGGGLATALTALITIRPTVRKANAAAETVRIDNVDKATHILIENIVEPLKKELNATSNQPGTSDSPNRPSGMYGAQPTRRAKTDRPGAPRRPVPSRPWAEEAVPPPPCPSTPRMPRILSAF